MVAVAGAALGVAALGTGCTNQPLDEVAPLSHELDLAGETVDLRQQHADRHHRVLSKVHSYPTSSPASDPTTDPTVLTG